MLPVQNLFKRWALQGSFCSYDMKVFFLLTSPDFSHEIIAKDLDNQEKQVSVRAVYYTKTKLPLFHNKLLKSRRRELLYICAKTQKFQLFSNLW